MVNQRQKLLVVQRTGWGKSSVYFISTKIFRDRGMGPTIIVSPLLALMRNQIESAQRLGINAIRWDSTNMEERPHILKSLKSDKVDALLIHPKQFSNQEFLDEVLAQISDRIGLMVVDEAHCISDWGHDFIPEYRLIANILKGLPNNTGVLGTTATANNRVIQDIQTQLGNIQIQRGPLIRESLALQNIVLPDQASRLAWLAQTIPQLPGTGIVYALTTRDAEQVAEWLVKNGIDAKAYHGSSEAGGFDNSNVYRQHLEDLLLNNQLKVLVATTALGMGYDKPDLGFVIHYQAPGSIVAYYQQVGRAGRGINYALGVLMSGTEDQNIHDYFRRTAFPSEKQVNEILDVLEQADGLSISEIEEGTNLRQGQIEKVLKLLSVESPAPIIKIGSQWRRTSVLFAMDQQRIAHLTQQREREWDEVQKYLTHKSCLMNYLRQALDDTNVSDCGKCASCLGLPVLEVVVDSIRTHNAASFLKHAEIPIEPRKQISQSNAEAARAFPIYNLPRRLGNLATQEGRVLSRWRDAGWGNLVADDKRNNHFRDELVDAVAEMISERWQPDPYPTWICCVPSMNHPQLVPDFAQRLAAKLGVPFLNAVTKAKANQPQKDQQNSFHQCHNLDGVFAIHQPVPNGAVLLVDDIVDSRWTLTVIGALLQQAGSGVVFPVALASSSVND